MVLPPLLDLFAASLVLLWKREGRVLKKPNTDRAPLFMVADLSV